jgi:hypothetical protein
MTERWVSLKKHYCKYCNTWIPDTKVSHQQHNASDRHRNAMQRNLSRIQKNDAIARNSGGNVYNPTAVKATASGGTRATAAGGGASYAGANAAAYGYGARDDMAGWMREAKKMNFENLQTETAEVPLKSREVKVGEWEVTQVIRKDDGEDEGDGKVKPEAGVKKEESPERGNGLEVAGEGRRGGELGRGKRERQRTPEAEDLVRFKVKEKTFPVDIKEEGEDVNVPVMGFKKRKSRGKKI